MSKLEHVLPEIIKSLKSTYGGDFFNEITLQLNNIIGADYTFIAQVDLNKFTAKTISLVAKDQLTDNFEYNLNNTPCAILTDNNICIYPKDICRIFPHDQLLIDMNIEGYVGVPLQNSQGNITGIIVALYEKEIKEADFAKTLFELFSGRIAAEIERSEQENHLEQLNKDMSSKVNALINSETKLSLHIQNTPLGCITWDRDFHCTEWNKSAEKIFGYSAKEAIGKHATELIVPANFKEDINKRYQSLLKEEGGRQRTNKNITKEGKAIKCNWYNTPLIMNNGSVSGITSLVQDITGKEQEEELLRRTQKMDALGKLTGGIAHDQNNMLNIITGYADLLSLKLVNNPELLNYVTQIQQASKRSALLISKLLSFSKNNLQSASKININDFLLEQEDMLQKTITVRITLTLKLSDELWSVWLDENDLGDAILNLCINSMHAMDNKNSIAELIITSKNVTLDSISAKAKGVDAGDYVMLSIADNGYGIEKEIKEKIFDPFFSTKGEQGTGLGLSQVLSFVNNSNGSIHLDSIVNHSAEFTLYFPRYNNQHSENKTINKVECVSPKGSENILIVEDEKVLRELGVKLLSLKGYNIFSADGHKEALEILKKEDINLMLSDVIMPEMNGYQLASIVQKKYPLIKIQLVSGYVDSNNISITDKNLQKNLIQKPYDLKELYNKIRTLLDE